MILIKYDNNISVKAPAKTAFGLPVTVTGAIATSENFVGLAAPDNTVQAENEDLGEYYPAGSTMKVLLRSAIQGRVVSMAAGGTFSAGNYVKLGASGKLVVEGTATTKTLQTVGIAKTAGANGSMSEVLIL